MTSVRLLQLFVLAVMTALLGAYGLLTWRDYLAARTEAERSLAEVTRLMEEHTRAALLAGELQLWRIQDLIGGRPRASLDGSEPDWQRLKQIVAQMPQADSAWIFDADANLRLSTVQPSGIALSAADRAYFTAARDGAPQFVSPMIWGKLYGGFYFAMSRRLADAEGRFQGVAQLSLKAAYFSDFYRTLRPEDEASFSIFKDDGALVARHPLPPPGGDTYPLPNKLLVNLEQAAQGTYTIISNFDDIERLYVYRRVAGHPLVVVAGLPTQVVFAGWRERTSQSLVLAAAGLAVLSALAWALSRAMAREQAGRAKAEALLADKEVLFQEIHHRVKNNLQIISSFLTMQSLKTGDPVTAEAFEEALSRIQSMGLVHQTLYEQNEASSVSMDAYLHALAASIGTTYGAEQRHIALEVDAGGMCLDLESAVPLALLANEALTNALKHAFPDGRPGTVRIRLDRDQGGMTFSVADDGIGMPESVQPTGGLGFPILSALAGQLRGSLAVERMGGTRIAIAFPA